MHHDRDDTKAYSDGYRVGQTNRDEQTAHRSQDGRPSGHHSYVSLDDLVGAKGSGVDSALQSRGFSNTSAYEQNGRSFASRCNAAPCALGGSLSSQVPPAASIARWIASMAARVARRPASKIS